MGIDKVQTWTDKHGNVLKDCLVLTDDIEKRLASVGFYLVCVEKPEKVKETNNIKDELSKMATQIRQGLERILNVVSEI